jgi:hypothetical protein
VAVDALGNSYVTGHFKGTVDFDPGPGVEEHTAEYPMLNAFLSKFDSDSNFIWVRTWGAPNYYNGAGEGKFITVGDFGDIYIAGIFYNTVDFDPGPGIEEHTSAGNSDIYLSKFNPDGVFQGVTTWGGGAYDSPDCLASAGGYIYITTTEYHKVTNKSYESLTKLDLTGAHQWAYKGCGWFLSVDAADSGNIYLSGIFSGTFDFDQGPGIQYHTSQGWTDMFLMMFPPDGNW